MKSSDQLKDQLRATSSLEAKRTLVKLIKKAKERELQEEDDLRYQIRKCRSCGLNRTRTNAVPWTGPTRGRADLVVVGEAPGEREDRKGIPFIGQSGKLLDFALGQAGTVRERVFVMNNLCCRPPENRDPRARELKACRPNFDDQLEMSGCMVGVTLGAYSLSNVMGVSRGSVSIGEMRGKPIWVEGRIWVPTYHPAYVLRNRKQIDTLVGDLQLALALRFAEDQPLPTPPWEQIEVDGRKRGEDMGKRIEKKGFALIHSATLGCQIVVARDEAALHSLIPQKLQHLPAYTVDELIRVGLIGKGREWTQSSLRRLHMVKSEFDGMVVQ